MGSTVTEAPLPEKPFSFVVLSDLIDSKEISLPLSPTRGATVTGLRPKPTRGITVESDPIIFSSKKQVLNEDFRGVDANIGSSGGSSNI